MRMPYCFSSSSAISAVVTDPYSLPFSPHLTGSVTPYALVVVANKIRDAEDEAFIRANIPADALLGFMHYNPEVIDADRRGLSPYDVSPTMVEEIRKIKARMDQN